MLNALFQNNNNNLNDELNRNFEDNDKRNIKSYINNYELKNNDVNKILRNIKNRNKYIIPNILDLKNSNTQKNQIYDYFNDLNTRNISNFLLDKSPSHSIGDRININQLEKLKNDYKNDRLKLEFGLLNINIKNPIIKIKKIESNSQLINNNTKINKENNEIKGFNISENNISNNGNSYKNIFTSEKHKNNYYLNLNRDNIKNNLFKIKIINKNKNIINISKKKLYCFDKITNNKPKDSYKILFNKKINKNNNNIKIILNTKQIINNNLKEDKIEKIEKSNQKPLSSGIKEIKLKTSNLKEINIIKKNSNQIIASDSMEDIKKENNELETYEIGEKLGEGSYATVKICKNKKTSKKYAMKIYDKIKMDKSYKKILFKVK